jgi:hypothetical protein
MNEDLHNEVEALNSIYGDGSLIAAEDGVYILRLPDQATSLRIRFPSDYPAVPPSVLGVQSSGEHTRRGKASRVVDVFKDTIGALFHSGEVCLFDVIEEVNSALGSSSDPTTDHTLVDESTPSQDLEPLAYPAASNSSPEDDPAWTLSDVVIELKSVFIARCTSVSSPDQATRYLQHLLDNEKKVREATHNITAWRIKGPNGVTFQDCNDDGETAAGGRVLHLMQLMDLWNVMVVVTRWYGGHQLGPKRFSIINTTARDAFVKAGFVTEDGPGKKKGKR